MKLASSMPTNGSTRRETTSGLNSRKVGSNSGGSKKSSASRASIVPGPTTGSVGESPRSVLYAITAAPVAGPNAPSRPLGPTEKSRSTSAAWTRLTASPLSGARIWRTLSAQSCNNGSPAKRGPFRNGIGDLSPHELQRVEVDRAAVQRPVMPEPVCRPRLVLVHGDTERAARWVGRNVTQPRHSRVVSEAVSSGVVKPGISDPRQLIGKPRLTLLHRDLNGAAGGASRRGTASRKSR